MNKTALTLQMLVLLQSRGRMKKAELAEALHTNVRNIREYKKELVAAGYDIIEYKGRNGGLALDQESLLPMPDLTSAEIQSLVESRQLIQSHPEFTQKEGYNSAIDKILCASHRDRFRPISYLPNARPASDESMNGFIQVCQEAIRRQLRIRLTYQTRQGQEAETFDVEPYIVFHYNNAYYLAAWSPRRKGWRNYRFSAERMKDCQLTEDRYAPDPDFRLENVIGRDSIIKGEFKKYEIAVQVGQEHLFKEVPWGDDLHRCREERGWVYYDFFRDDEINLFNMLFEMRDAVRLISPESAVNAWTQHLKSILTLYKEDVPA